MARLQITLGRCGFCDREISAATGFNLHHPQNPQQGLVMVIRLCRLFRMVVEMVVIMMEVEERMRL